MRMSKVVDNTSKHDAPKRRPLKIFASDPMTGRNLGNRARVDVENERLEAGPHGQRLMVVDFNATTGKYYPPVNLDDPALLMQGGLDPTESDPRFHQQMVYAVAMRTLENFDRALGRRIYLNNYGMPLRLFPHAFYGANAYFDDKLHAILFGYFRADADEPGENLPGQTVFTCLSHDIIAHEMTHAIVNRLRRNYLEPSNIDVLAFHEAFSDLVALFQHFSFVDVVKAQIYKTGFDLRAAKELLGLAHQFGHATAAGQALRSALGEPDMRLSDDITEPHERGAILVAAVFDAFIKVYEKRTADLVRLAQAGAMAPGTLPSDLVNRLAAEAARIAQSMLTMCIRAFDYMPPVDVTFGDFLRAVVTADFELSPDDETGQRAALIEGFRLRGIYPRGVTSLAEESLVWDPAEGTLPPLNWDPKELLSVIVDAASRVTGGSSTMQSSDSPSSGDANAVPSPSAKQYLIDDVPTQHAPKRLVKDLSIALQRYATQNAKGLMLDSGQDIRALGVHPVFRVAPTGRLVIELVAQVDQQIKSRQELGGLPARGGSTLIVSFNGTIKYVIAKPLPGANLDPEVKARAEARLERQAMHLKKSDARDPMTAYMTDKEFTDRAKTRGGLSTLHFTR
jgi:hypothetical protein